ncbi:putative transmembrane protein [Rhizobium etli CIAT 652]|uniref:Putative transmembrane protein n=1 Tax=Rhizobium etli (strain CIAT 652) TaxID=491916 RepID=B3PSX4_RHIE6|nr:hypothetical protein [Rhizobium phaseoli]ACE90140.1 putative transmembrane protein [Rhizobium etli CIAT 652]
MTVDRIAVWLMFGLTGGICANCWYWYLRSWIFYVKNGFDFSEDFGPNLYLSEAQGDDRYLATPRQKFLILWPVLIIGSSIVPLGILLALIVPKPCVSCAP